MVVQSTKTMNSYKFDKNTKSLSTSKVKKSGISGFLRNSWMKGKQLLGLSETEKRIPYRTKPHKSKLFKKITKAYKNLYYWGRQPKCSKNPSSLIQFGSEFKLLKLSAQKIQKVSIGENHLIMMDQKDQLHGYGDNRFHQLDGNLGHLDDLVALSFNQKLRVESIYLGCDFSFLLDKDFNVRNLIPALFLGTQFLGSTWARTY